MKNEYIDKCPKCGAKVLDDQDDCTMYDCRTISEHFGKNFVNESALCLRRQIEQYKSEIERLKKEAEK